MVSIQTYPDEVLLEIAYNLEYDELRVLRRVSRRFSFIWNDKVFWKVKAKRDFGVKSEEFEKGMNGDTRSNRRPRLSRDQTYLYFADKNGKVYIGSERFSGNNTLRLLELAGEKNDPALISYFLSKATGQDNYMMYVIDGLSHNVNVDPKTLYYMTLSMDNWDKERSLMYAIENFAQSNRIDEINYLMSLEVVDVNKCYKAIVEGSAAGGHFKLYKKYYTLSRGLPGSSDGVLDASINGRVQILRYLDSLNALNSLEVGSCVSLCKEGEEKALEILREFYDRSDNPLAVTEAMLEDAVYSAVEKGYLKVLQYWISKSDIDFDSAVDTAIFGRHLDIVMYLFYNHEESIKASAIEKYGEYNERVYLSKAVSSSEVEIVDFFLYRNNFNDEDLLYVVNEVVDANDADDRLLVYVLDFYRPSDLNVGYITEIAIFKRLIHLLQFSVEIGAERGHKMDNPPSINFWASELVEKIILHDGASRDYDTLKLLLQMGATPPKKKVAFHLFPRLQTILSIYQSPPAEIFL